MSEALPQERTEHHVPDAAALSDANTSAVGSVREWILHQLKRHGFPWEPYLKDGIRKITDDNSARFGAMAPKMLLGTSNIEDMEPSIATWLGGVCSISTGRGEAIRTGRMSFKNESDFADWMEATYPRLDTILNAVAPPPAICHKLIYVVEDSIWARRLAKWTGLNATELTHILREVHEKQGDQALLAWLSLCGYSAWRDNNNEANRRDIEVVYTSDLEKELRIMLETYKLLQNIRVKAGKVDGTLVSLMYTNIWKIALGMPANTEVAIMEPMEHLLDIPSPNPFPVTNLYQGGFLPAYSAEGPLRSLPYDQVIHRGNYRGYQAKDRWDIVNFRFASKKPQEITLDQVNEFAQRDLSKIYELP